MTMSTESCVVTYAGNDELTEFPFNFKIFEDTDLKALLRDADGNETSLISGTDFTVSGANSSTGGSVTYPASGEPMPQGASLTLFREIPFTQTLELVENDPFPANLIEQQFDRAVMRDQQIKERLDRSLAYSVAAPEEERLTAEEYVDAVTAAKSTAESEADATRAAHRDAALAADDAAAHAASALLEADRASAATVNVDSMVDWWSRLSVSATRNDAACFTAPGDLTSIFTPGRAVRFSESEGSVITAGYVVQSTYDGTTTTFVSTSCSVPEGFAHLEYGQSVENSPRPGPKAMVPNVSGPVQGNESSVVELGVSRTDGSDYSSEVSFELQALATGDGSDATAEFSISTSSSSSISLTLPEVAEDTEYSLRFRASDGVLGLSDLSAPITITVKHVTMLADNAAVLEAAAADWPIQSSDRACSKTVGQEEGEPDWTTLSAQYEFDADDAALTVDGYTNGTMQCSDTRSGLTAPFAIKPVGSDDCVVVDVEPTETDAESATLVSGAAGTIIGDFTVTPENAFDGVTDTSEVATTGNESSLQTKCLGKTWEQAKRLTGFKVYRRNDGEWTSSAPNSNLVTFVLQGSNDAFSSQVVDLDTVTIAHNSTATYVEQSGSIVTGTAYTSHRIALTFSGDAGWSFKIAEVEFYELAHVYTWTNLDQSPHNIASVEKVYKLPDCYVGTGGEFEGAKELIVPETELDVVSKSGTALTVKYPANLTGLFKVAQHDTIQVNGTTDVAIESAGGETGVVDAENKDYTFNTTGSSWTGITCRTIVPADTYSLESIEAFTVDFEASSSGEIVIDLCYIGQATSDTDFDFVSTPTQVTFNGGSSDVTVAASGVVTSDAVDFAIDPSLPVVVSWRYLSASSVRRAADESYQCSTDNTSTRPDTMTWSGITYQYNSSLARVTAIESSALQTTLTLATDPGSLTTAVVSSRFPTSAEVPESVVRSDLSIDNPLGGTKYNDASTVTSNANANLNIDSSYTIPAGSVVGCLGIYQSTGQGQFTGTVCIVLDNGTTATNVAEATFNFTGDNAFHYAALDTPYTVPDTGTYRLASYSAESAISMRSGSRKYVVGQASFGVGTTSDTLTTTDTTYAPLVAWGELGDGETHDKLTIKHAERNLNPSARSTAMLISRPEAEADQTYNATINLYTGA